MGGSGIEARVRRDTGVFHAPLSGAWRSLFVASLAAALLAVAPPSRGANQDTLRNRLLWIKGGRAYIALSDTSHVAEGDSVRFEDRRKQIAGGRVASVVHGEVAIVSLTSGSLARAGKPERIVVTTLPSPVAPPRVLRVAIPADDRDNLLFRCAAIIPRPPAEAPRYRSERVGAREVRLVREDPAAIEHPWPDTLLVFLFEDAADEEIALERGDVDVAVFWPGELSQRLRHDARWAGAAFGTRHRGVLALVEAEGMTDAAPDTAWLSAFNDALFRGDLGIRDARAHPPWIMSSLYRLEADAELPGRQAIGQWLRSHSANPTASISPPGTKLPHARMAFVDAPYDTVAAEGFIPLLQLRLPVLTGRMLRPLVHALGAEALANLAQCSGAEGP